MKPDRPSATAYLIAESLAGFGSNKKLAALVPAEAARLSRAFADARPFGQKIVARAKQSFVFEPFFAFLENRMIPGIRLHYALRKRRIEEIARAALLADFAQVVVFGAGFDTLAFRLHREFQTARFVEIDHPATQSAKQAAISSRRLVGDNLFFVPLDLGDERNFDRAQSNKVFQNGFEPDRKTLFIAEGLLMYFSLAEVDRLFDFVNANCLPASRFAFTFMEKQRDGRICFQNSSRAVDWWLKRKGEPFKSGFCPDELPNFLKARGFALRSLDSATDFRRKYLTAPELAALKSATGESLCVAEKI